MPLSDTLSPLTAIFYPSQCKICGVRIKKSADVLCVFCLSDLPHTGFQHFAENPAETMFAGRLPIYFAHSEFYFSPQGGIRKLIHELKYKGNRDAGRYLGRAIGKSLQSSFKTANIHSLIPLPLYPDRQAKRGYNQAAIICEGINETTGIPIDVNSIVRKKQTETQTKKHRTDRWKNVCDSFCIIDKSQISGKNILLVDDVVTTGATLEACGSVLIREGGGQIAIATAAIACK